MIIRELFARIGLDVDESGLKKVEGMFEGWKGAMLGLGTIAVAAGAALLEIARETGNAGKEISLGAQRVGLTTDAFQELKFAAEDSGVSVEGLEIALSHLEKAAYKAKHGSTEAAEAFHGLLNLNDFKTGTPDELLEKMADGFIKIKDPQERAAKVMEIFGKSGKALIPLLNKGKEGIEALRIEAHELGIVMSEEDIKAAEEYEHSMKRLSTQIRALRNSIGSAVIPTLLKLGKAMREATKAFKDFADVHAEAIFQTVRFALLLLTAATVAWGISSAAWLSFVAQYYTVLGVQAVAAAVKAASAWLVAAAPLIAIGVAIAVVVAWLQDLYYFLTGGESVIGDFVASITDGLMGPDGLKGIVMDVVRWFLQYFPDSFAEGAAKAVGWMIDKVSAGLAFVKNLLLHPLEVATQAAVSGAGMLLTPGAGAGMNIGATGFQGGAVSPAASVAQSPAAAGATTAKVQIQAPVQIDVHASPGMDESKLADHVAKKIDEHHDRVMRESLAGTP